MKLKKIIAALFVVCLFGVASFTIYHISANEKIEVKKYVYNTFYVEYGIIYSNNTGYFWRKNSNYIIDNITDAQILGGDHILYIDTDNNLCYYSDQTCKLILNDVKEMRSNNDNSLSFLTNNNELYLLSNDFYSLSNSFSYDSIYGFSLYLLAENVNDYIIKGTSFIYRDNSNNLYAIGENIFGNKINDGNYLDTPTLLLENVSEYKYSNYSIIYAIKDNDLYVLSKNLPLPTILTNDVEEIIKWDYSPLIYKKKDGNYYFNNYKIENNEIKSNEKVINFQSTCHFEEGSDYSIHDTLLIDNTLFNLYYNYKSGNKYTLCAILTNVKDYQKGYALDNSGDLYLVNPAHSNTLVLEKLTHLNNFEMDKTYKIMSNVKDIAYLNYDYNVIIMDDDTIWATAGSNNYNFFRDNTITYSNIPVLLKDLPNVPETTYVRELDLITLSKTDFTVGDTFDYYVNILPFNAVNKDVIWSSSNEDVATVDSLGTITMKAEGTTTISVSLADGSLEDEVEIHVYPAPSSIEIINGDVINVARGEKVTLNARVYPENTLKTNVKWSSNNDDLYLENNNSNELSFYSYPSGSYEITVTTEDGKYSDTITINTIEKVSDIRLTINSNNFDGIYNAFIYLDEGKTLKIDYEIYPTTATNKNVTFASSDESIATISSDGIITAKKPGRCSITINSEDQNTSTRFNLTVYNSNNNIIIGDVNGDGEVDILDLIKLRRYLAGLEESLE